jgi:subtilisin family serine protease
MPSGWRGFCEAPSDSSAPLTCNNKLIGARQFLNTYKAFIDLTAGEFDSARDSEGHGTHTASTAAGNFWVESHLFGIPRGAVSGIAPRAHVAVYRVCAQEGCFGSDSVAAIDQAIADGVEVINFSISGGSDPYSDAVELSFLGAYAAGVFVAASAGNSGPAPDTVDHRGGWVTTVAASTTDRHFLSGIVLTASDGASLQLTGASTTAGITTPTLVVLGKSFGDSLCNLPFPAGTFNGVIVVCERGELARVAKSFNVAAGGAGGLLLYNPIAQGLATDNHFIPTVHVENDAGAALLNFLASHAGVTATFTQGTATAVQGDTIAAFSSRGGPQQELGISKPDVTAPGVQILAGHTPQPHTTDGGRPGEVFQVIQGSSMSTPHVAGAAALLKALRPAWGPDQIKSALMTSAKTVDVLSEDGVTPSYPFDAGSGRIDLGKADDPGLTFTASAQDYLEYRNTLWLVNYPSLYIPRLSDSIRVSRTVRSELSTASLWHVSVVAPADLVVTTPTFLLVPPGGIMQFNITVDASAVPSGTARHASLYLTWSGLQVTFPITIVRQ